MTATFPVPETVICPVLAFLEIVVTGIEKQIEDVGLKNPREYIGFLGTLFLFVALPFLILFVSGVAVDLLESRYGILANAVVVGALIANATLDVYGLLELRHLGVR